MARALLAAALLCTLASPAVAARRHEPHRPACVPVTIEFIPVVVCAPLARR